LAFITALGLTASGDWGLVIAPAFAHGAGGGGSLGGMGPLIFIPVIIGFALFLAFVDRK